MKWHIICSIVGTFVVMVAQMVAAVRGEPSILLAVMVGILLSLWMFLSLLLHVTLARVVLDGVRTEYLREVVMQAIAKHTPEDD